MGGAGGYWPTTQEEKAMAKTTAPLLSFSASGQIAKTQVYSRWKGRSYVRRHVVPANPRSTEQSLTRDTFSWLQAVYKLMPPGGTAPWELFAKGKVLTPRNAFTSKNLPGLRPASDLADFVASPGALGGPAPTSVTAITGAGTGHLSVVAPLTIPSGWTLTGAQGLAILDQDPQVGTDYVTYFAEDLTAPYSVVFDTLPAGLVWMSGWLKWMRPDGLVAYSPSLSDSVVIT